MLATIAEVGLEGVIEAPRQADGAVVEEALGRALCLLLPSWRKGCGLVLLDDRPPSRRASSALSSSEPLSTTMTSPAIPLPRGTRRAEVTHSPMLSALCRHGMTTDTRIAFAGAADARASAQSLRAAAVDGNRSGAQTAAPPGRPRAGWKSG
jgi:hypothetical protein